VTFFTGHDHTGEAPGALDWAALAKSSPVLVGYMAIKTLPSIATSLIAAGRSAGEPVAIIMDATLPTMRVLETTLGRAVEDLAASGMGPPAILCIGRVALMRQTLDWIGQMAGDAPRDLDPLGDGSARDAG
jgi:uroporphyrin-III C-methyltransferase